jgi:uncharacterized protein YlzI (FlbEa/FlbD family)
MKSFDQIYTESAKTATLTLGFNGTSGKVLVEKAQNGAESIVLDASTSTASLGGDKAGDGNIQLWNASGKNTVSVTSSVKVDIKKAPDLPGTQRDLGGAVVVRNSDGAAACTLEGTGTLSLGEGQAIVLQGASGVSTFGAAGANGFVNLKNSNAIETISLYGATGGMTLRNNDRVTIILDGMNGDLTLGGSGTNGDLVIKNSNDDQIFSLQAESGNLTLGGSGINGDVLLKNSNGAETIILDSANGALTLGGTGVNGDILLKNSEDVATVSLNSANGDLTLGGSGTNGDISLKNSSDVETVHLDSANGILTLGGTGVNGDVLIKNNSDIETIKITGSNGDIEFLNADVAEEFDIQPDALTDVLPGTVVVVDECGRLRPCEEAYDRRVVGVVAGAGRYRPAIVLDRKGGRDRLPVAMIGKVYCWVEADSDQVRVGDLLTTSCHRGHARRASDPLQAFGSLIGKALQPLSQGRALIPVLVKA